MRSFARGSAAVVFAAVCVGAIQAKAAVVWSDDFTGQSDGAAPSHDETGNSVNDYSSPNNVSITGSIGNAAPALAVNDTSTTSANAVVTLPMSQFQTFDTSNSSTPILRLSFDVRIDSYLTTNNNAYLRVILRDNTANGRSAVFGFSYADLDADAATQDLAFFATTVNSTTLPTTATAVGLQAGGTWASGFDFGDYDSGNAEANDTNDRFYRVVMEYNAADNGITDTVTDLGPGGGTVNFPAGLALSSSVLGFTGGTGSTDQILIASATGNSTLSYVDNIVVESVPEPTTISGVILGAGMLMRRRRR